MWSVYSVLFKYSLIRKKMFQSKITHSDIIAPLPQLYIDTHVA